MHTGRSSRKSGHTPESNKDEKQKPKRITLSSSINKKEIKSKKVSIDKTSLDKTLDASLNMSRMKQKSVDKTVDESNTTLIV